jgi:LysM repeat protein
VVEAGDTLWSIAREYVPTGNISDFVYELARMNGVDIEVGQVIRVP